MSEISGSSSSGKSKADGFVGFMGEVWDKLEIINALE
jgi:hypothetical protein